jgi:predicted NAD-dependent protein-ADP-ribosyltransferase YbiA (DUF1768 family)
MCWEQELPLPAQRMTSTQEDFWGTGPHEKGVRKLGFLLMF